MTTERIKKWNYISSQVYQFLADMEEDSLVLIEREKELLHMYHALTETDQQVVYGLVSCFYDKTPKLGSDRSVASCVK